MHRRLHNTKNPAFQIASVVALTSFISSRGVETLAFRPEWKRRPSFRCWDQARRGGGKQREFLAMDPGRDFRTIQQPETNISAGPPTADQAFLTVGSHRVEPLEPEQASSCVVSPADAVFENDDFG